MASSPDMSVQLESSPTSLLPPSSSLGRLGREPLVESNPTSADRGDHSLKDIIEHNQTSQEKGEEQEEQGALSSSIVFGEMHKPSQNFSIEPTWNSLLGPMQGKIAQEHRTNTDTIQTSHEEVMAVSHSFEQQEPYMDSKNNIDHPSTLSSPLPYLATEVGNSRDDDCSIDSCSWGVGALFTTRSVSSHHGNHPKPAEPAFSLLTEHMHHDSRHAFPQRQPQQHTSNLLLQQQHQKQVANRPPIQLQSATAAQIALGRSSSSYNDDNQEMGDGTQTGGIRHFVGHSLDSKEDSTIGDFSFLLRKDGEEKTSRTEDSLVTSSPGRMTPLPEASDHGSDNHRMVMVMGTPSTVSTAPSSDDASLGNEYKLEESMLPNLLHPLGHHRSATTWGEEVLLPSGNDFATPPRRAVADIPCQNPWMSTLPTGSSAHREDHAHQRSPRDEMHTCITPQNPPQPQRIASFRNDSPWNRNMPQQMPSHLQHHTPNSQHPHHFLAHPQLPSPQLPQHQQQHSRQNLRVPRKQSYSLQAGHHLSGQHGSQPNAVTPISIPPKIPRQQRQPSARQPGAGSQEGTSQHQPSTNSRSASEILKTLLRKKACLYEPDTSRSVALVTWLVGRELALEYGFFSRQQLQSGVHACVSDKIESGTITRTKVNRCMQIILNSCFHYIIPRSDGSEENGDYFRASFSTAAQDDSALLQHLPEPWNDLKVQREAVLEACMHDSDEKSSQQGSVNGKSPCSTPKTSPKLSSVNAAEKSPDRDQYYGDKDDTKRAVLLCFNENVRSAEDVFRCHNEFVRDTANAAHLQLTAQEWRQFFGRETSRSPYLWGNIGIPTLTGESDAGPARRPDLLGQMSRVEVGKFRSTWCTKRYDHDHDLCGFAHVEVNGGWLRRNPLVHLYKDEMCKFISTAGDTPTSTSQFFLNECPKGIRCEFAHSMEEIVYHPNRYKMKVCTSLYSQNRGCRSGDVCPNLHPPDVTKPMRKAEILRSQGIRRKNDPSNASAKLSPVTPTGAPVVYATPAPFSSFDQLLGMPGLQNIYRRQSAVIRAHVRSSGRAKCLYSPFGDDWGIVFGRSP